MTKSNKSMPQNGAQPKYSVAYQLGDGGQQPAPVHPFPNVIHGSSSRPLCISRSFVYLAPNSRRPSLSEIGLRESREQLCVATLRRACCFPWVFVSLPLAGPASG